MSEGFVLRGIGDPEDVGERRSDRSLFQSFIRNLSCLLRRCDPQDVIHLRRRLTRAEMKRHKAGWVEYGLLCGRCDRLLSGYRTAPKGSL